LIPARSLYLFNSRYAVVGQVPISAHVRRLWKAVSVIVGFTYQPLTAAGASDAVVTGGVDSCQTLLVKRMSREEAPTMIW